MKRFFLLAIVALAVTAGGLAETAWAGGGHHRPCAPSLSRLSNSAGASWHGGYYDSAWGTPVALVVPPTAEFQTKWGWGVNNTQVVPIRSQFSRDYPGPNQYNPRIFRPTPPWPSHTDQFGDYYVRGPW